IALGVDSALITCVLLLAAGIVMAWLCRRRIGGQTGGTLGALEQGWGGLGLLGTAARVSGAPKTRWPGKKPGRRLLPNVSSNAKVLWGSKGLGARNPVWRGWSCYERRSAVQLPAQLPPLHEPWPEVADRRPEPEALLSPYMILTATAPSTATLPEMSN